MSQGYRADDVDFERRSPIVNTRLDKKIRERHSGVVNQDVERVDDVGVRGQRLDILGIREVQRYRAGAEAPGDVVETFRRAAGEQQRVGGRGSGGGGGAEGAGGPGGWG